MASGGVRGRLRRWGLVALVLAAAGLYLFAPLASARFRITVDQAKLEGRARYLAAPASAAPPGRRPNIVLILADDLGKTDVSAYGGPVPTPNIDAIGTRGATCTEGYITSPICSPSRAGLITGRYQQRFGHELQPHDRYPRNRLEYYVYKYLLAPADWVVTDEIAYPDFEAILQQGLPLSELTLAEVLKKHGYQTAIMGKWHLGTNDTSIPIHRGFDYHYGFYEAFSLYADPNAPDIVNHRQDHFADRHMWSVGRTGNCALRRNHEVIEDTAYLTQRIAEESARWIDHHRDEPFFLYVPFSAPHSPFQVPRRYHDRFADVADPSKRVYYGMIAALDDAVGTIMATLRRLALEEHTLVFFLSDNGGALYTGVTDNGPLKGGKLTNFEGGINVPFLVQYAGTIPSGAACTFPVSALDVFATAVDAAGGALPTDRPYDGVSLLPHLMGPVSGPPHAALFWRAAAHKAVRQGDWKLVKDEKSKRTVLYDLRVDKAERQDLAGARPEIVRQLELALAEWEKAMVSPLWPRVMDFRFEAGDEVYFFPL
jgi:arylsulfatase A-like enzyme